MASLPALSFNCVICFDQFNEEDGRAPVVLPCGHTYVCAECADKLDKCMECRETLFVTHPAAESAPVPVSGGAQQDSAPRLAQSPSARDVFYSDFAASMATSRSSLRTGGRVRPAYLRQQSAPAMPKAQPMKKTRHPLPKNTVLLYLMDAHMKARHSAKTVSQEELTPETQDMLAAKDSNVDCGTYAVLAKDGLTIVPTKKSTNNNTQEGEGDPSETELKQPAHPEEPLIMQNMPPSMPSSKEDVSVIFEEYHAARKLNESTESDQSESLRRVGAGDDRNILKCGDRIQVVSFDDGWAKLARGYGYVHCPVGTEIVRIANYADNACKLEGALHSLASISDDLQREREKILLASNSIKRGLQESLSKQDDVTIVSSEFWRTMQTDATEALSVSSSDGSDDEEVDRTAAAAAAGSDAAGSGAAVPETEMDEQDLDETFHAIQRAQKEGENKAMDWLMCFAGKQLPPTTTDSTGGVGGSFEAAAAAGRVLQDMYPTSSSVPSRAVMKQFQYSSTRSTRSNDSISDTASASAVDFATGRSARRPVLKGFRKQGGEGRRWTMSSHTGLTVSKKAQKNQRRSSLFSRK